MKKLLIVTAIWFGTLSAAFAETVEDRLIAGLQSQGYVILEQGYTWLGRLRIVAETDLVHRELVINPGTGEILRDYAILLADMDREIPSPSRNNRRSPTAVASVDETSASTDGALAATAVPRSGVAEDGAELGGAMLLGDPLFILKNQEP